MTRHALAQAPERDSYRQRRIRDGARVLPVFGVILMILPLLWPRGETGQSLTSSALVYIFVVWIGLIGLAALLARHLTLSKADRLTGPKEDIGSLSAKDEGASL